MKVPTLVSWLVQGGSGFAVGIIAWTLIEYLLHRWAMHGRAGRGIASREHLRHHARPEQTAPAMRSLAYLGSFAGGGALTMVLAPSVAPTLAVGAGVGLAAGHTAYELGHWRAHHRAAANRWERWIRPRHFHHHFVSPRSNFGVTIDVWDRAFGTYEEPGMVPVPRRLAMPWLLDESGQVRADLAGHYRLVGRQSTTAADDLDRAMDELPPLP